MGLLDIIDKGLIINPLTSVKKEDIIRDLVDLYCDRKSLGEDERDAIFKAVIDREMIASTAMEKGIAIPHAKIPFLKESAIVIGVSRIPVDFGGAEKSSIFFLVLASDDNPSEHIQLLSSIAKVASSQLFVRMLLSSMFIGSSFVADSALWCSIS